MNKYKLDIEVDSVGLVELSVALAQAIALIEERKTEEVDAFYRAQQTLRHLLTHVHSVVNPDFENGRCRSVNHFGKSTYLFY